MQSKTLIDLLLTSRPELYNNSSVIRVGFSDHFAVFGVRKLHRVKSIPPKIVEIRNYKNYDPTLFKTDLSYVPLELELNPEEAWKSFKDLFTTVANNHAPTIKRRVRRQSLPWITPDMKKLIHAIISTKKPLIQVTKVSGASVKNCEMRLQLEYGRVTIIWLI